MASEPSAMVTASLVGAQQLKDDMLVAISGSDYQPTLDGKAEATLADEGTSGVTRIVVNSASPAKGAVPDDVVMLVCGAGDVGSVQALADRLWGVTDAAPQWQPMMLLVLYRRPDDVSSSHFTNSLRELQNRLERDSRFIGTSFVALTDALPRDAVPNTLSLASTLLSSVDVVKTPTHVIWDHRASSLTMMGVRALRRAFWLIDVDRDGFLSDAEVLHWCNKMFDGSCDDDVTAFKQHLTDVDQRHAAGEVGGHGAHMLAPEGVTITGFLEITEEMLRDGRASGVWAMLWDTGICHDGLPFTADMLARAPVPTTEHCVQLSVNGTRFFSGLHSRRDGHPSLSALWGFTPECPWLSLPGLPLPDDSLSTHEFVTCWKTLALYNPAVVAQFAFYWGYRSDAALLFVVKPTRDLRVEERDWPTTMKVMVVGATACGKTSLLRRLTSARSPDDVEEGHSTSVGGRGCIVRSLNVPYMNESVTLVLEEVSEADALQDIASPDAMASFDGVLVCFTLSDDRSVDFLYETVPMLAQYNKLPIVFALTKADLPFSDTPRKLSLDMLLRKHGLPWCPFTLSVFDDRLAMLGLSNDLDSVPTTLVDALHCVEATRIPTVSTARKIRRIAIVTAGIAVVGLVLRRLFSGRSGGSTGAAPAASS